MRRIGRQPPELSAPNRDDKIVIRFGAFISGARCQTEVVFRRAAGSIRARQRQRQKYIRKNPFDR